MSCFSVNTILVVAIIVVVVIVVVIIVIVIVIVIAIAIIIISSSSKPCWSCCPWFEPALLRHSKQSGQPHTKWRNSWQKCYRTQDFFITKEMRQVQRIVGYQSSLIFLLSLLFPCCFFCFHQCFASFGEGLANNLDACLWPCHSHEVPFKTLRILDPSIRSLDPLYPVFPAILVFGGAGGICQKPRGITSHSTSPRATTRITQMDI